MDHIRLCRDRWRTHSGMFSCERCSDFAFGIIDTPCEQGQVLYDEYIASIEADRSCEFITGKDAPWTSET